MVDIDKDQDNGMGEIVIKQPEPFDIYIDPKSRDILFRDAAFILVPRRQQAIIKLNTKLGNILVRPNINLYQICQFCDFHSTVFSTFAAESIYMGVPNILINLNNLSDSYYSEIFFSHTGVKFVNKVEGYVETIKTWNPPDRVEIKKMSLDLFAKDNRDKIKLFLEDKINL